MAVRVGTVRGGVVVTRGLCMCEVGMTAAITIVAGFSSGAAGFFKASECCHKEGRDSFDGTRARDSCTRTRGIDTLT